MNVKNSDLSVSVTMPAEPMSSVSQQWKGMNLDELRHARAMALVRREVGRVKLQNRFAEVKTDVNNNGVRSLLFSNNAVAGLKKADYAFLGFKLAGLLLRLYRKKRR